MKLLPTLACFVTLAALSGCAEMGQLMRETQEFQAQMPAQRNYLTNPYVGPSTQMVQPNFNRFSATESEGYRTIMVNTPQGIVYKRCKLLNGAVACF